MSLYAVVLVDGSEYGDYKTPQVVRVYDWHKGKGLRVASFDGLGIFNTKHYAEVLKAEYEEAFPNATYAIVDGAKVVEEVPRIYKLKDSFNPNEIPEAITTPYEVKDIEKWIGRES